jgi:hypothetical protein
MESLNLLTACVICKDDRGFTLSQLLIEQFAEVYWVSSDSDYRKFSADNATGTIVPQRSLPDTFSAVFFHSGNQALWQHQSPISDYTFEFNTPGTPITRPGVIPIFRATGTYFGIIPSDIDEIARYVSGQQSHLPALCRPTLECLLALSMLCQGYLLAQATHPTVSDATWWQAGLGIGDLLPNDLEARIATEWNPWGHTAAVTEPVTALTARILAPTDSEAAITPAIVAAAYGAITETLRHSPDLPTLPTWTTHATRLLILEADRVSQAIATVASTLLNLPISRFDPTDDQADCKLLEHSILILTESRIKVLSVLRSRKFNFRGAVLVVSSQPFSVLKQKYRILCAGQGSHASFSDPWQVLDLQSHLATLLPLQPENLRLWRQESQEFEHRNKAKIASCQKDLQVLKNTPNIHSAVWSEHLKQLEQTVGTLRIETKFACHTPVAVLPDNGCRPIKDHLEQAFKELRTPNQRHQAISRLEQALNHLSDLLLSSVEPISNQLANIGKGG